VALCSMNVWLAGPTRYRCDLYVVVTGPDRTQLDLSPCTSQEKPAAGNDASDHFGQCPLLGRCNAQRVIRVSLLVEFVLLDGWKRSVCQVSRLLARQKYSGQIDA
jgi:hypothetical protein